LSGLFVLALPILLGPARDRWHRGVLDLEPMRQTTLAIRRTETVSLIKLTCPSAGSFKILKPGRRDLQVNQPLVILRNLMLRTTFVLTCVTFLILLPASSMSQDADAGKLAFNNACRTCHSLKEGDNRLGPNLYKVLGRKAGSLPNYGYSSAMKNADLIWDRTKLDRFIENPDAVVPGNNMKPYGGLASADVRAEVIVFLESLTTAQ
jgi:cytochrome c